MRGGGKVSDFFKKNALWLFIGLLIVLAIIVAILLFVKPREGFSNNRKLEYFYMNECPHCKDFHPVWNKLVSKITAENIPIDTAKYEISSDKGKPRADLFKITSAPTILLTENDKVIKEYNGKRDVDSIIAFIKNS